MNWSSIANGGTKQRNANDSKANAREAAFHAAVKYWQIAHPLGGGEG